jgi:hypothetical protein
MPLLESEAIDRAAAAARQFRALGYNALPGRLDRKGPALVSYARYHYEAVPDAMYDGRDSPNVSLLNRRPLTARRRLMEPPPEASHHQPTDRVRRRYRRSPGQRGETETTPLRRRPEK